MARPDTDSYRPRYAADAAAPLAPRAAHAPMYHFKGNRDQSRNDAHNRPRRGFTFKPPKAHERPLLTSSRQTSPEKITFASENAQDKFRDVDELTESDETDMDLSDSDEEENRPSKRLKASAADSGESKPQKWSNPDPYTALPPVEDSSRKKKDVVKLIRKARMKQSQSQSARESPSLADDFISFDLDDQEDHLAFPPRNAPTGPKLDLRSNFEGQHGAMEQAGETNGSRDTRPGKRKRSAYESPADPAITRGEQRHSDGLILRAWQAADDCDPCPWYKKTSPPIDPAGIALHKEVIDFYEWIRPQDYEAAIRADLVARLGHALNRLEPGELKAFGSYAAGLYLPTGDMDLVYLLRGPNSRRLGANGLPQKMPFDHFKRYRSFLNRERIARAGSVVIIPHAKVQIIKFVDAISGLKVDLCFNNEGGLTAIDTFHDWRTRYPAMPIIVSIIKQFLMIRGLNDVATGGLGGFSTICLVTSLIQHMPFTAQPPNLGQFLLEFFNLYGNLLNRDEVAIRLDPPGYIHKASYTPFAFNKDKKGRLSIIDPTRPDNNISGGTFQIETIVDCFSLAYDKLNDCLSIYEENPASIRSFLATIVGGDFSAYQAQRDVLHELYYGSLPPPPPIDTRGRRPPPPPPPPPARTSSMIGKLGDSSQRRAARLRHLRPDLADRIPNRISTKAAAELGDYKTIEEMSADLDRREKLLK